MAVGVFRAGEALAAGDVSRYELAAHHRRLLPGVWTPRTGTPTLADRIRAAWLWSERRGVVCGLAASALHGAAWVSGDIPIELNLDRHTSPRGVVVGRDTLLDGEVITLGGIAVTTVARTAFDLGRRGRRDVALERLDALARATRFDAGDVLAVFDAHRGVRGRRRVPGLLRFVDAGAQSPKETWLRLVLIEAGFPRPQTQIPVPAPDGYHRYFLDLGWPEYMVAVEYDGEQHRTDPAQYRADVLRAEYIDGLGWRRIRVLAGHRREDVIARVARAGVPRDFIECADWQTATRTKPAPPGTRR
ncbi:MAG: hypothetical protein ACR2JI_12155 [Mycobacterium sp.]